MLFLGMVCLTVALASSNGQNQQQPLCGWSEVPGHPGLVTCLTQSTNNPVILMVRPRSIAAQEIRVMPAGKAKIQDMVAIRHPASGAEHRTTLILLCEDGSLRIYMANSEATNFWLNATSPLYGGSTQLAFGLIGPPHGSRGSGGHRKRGFPADKGSRGSSCGPAGSSTRGSTPASFPSGQPAPIFGVDFFESCQQSNDVEFGGRDVLEVYNTQQLKHRLNITGMYVANTKASGFTIEVKNPNSSTTVMVGIRIQVGVQAVEKAPSYIELFGRTIQVAPLAKSRWFDIPFTREESLTTDKKCSIFFGPSQDASGVNMVDCIRVFTKTKEIFGWPDDIEEYTSSSTGGSQAGTSNNANVQGAEAVTSDDPAVLAAANAAQHHQFQQQLQPLTQSDRLLAKSLDTIDGALSSLSTLTNKDDELKVKAQKLKALDVATALLAVPSAIPVQQQTKGLLAALHPSSTEYHLHKDKAQLAHAQNFINFWTSLSQTGSEAEVPSRKEDQIDPEAFQRILAVVRTIAVQRPNNLVSSQI
jgi:E3 ubiquitin-protein ligase UBR4